MLSTIRHDSIFRAYDYKDFPIHIVGAGATGSRVFMSLIELGLTNISVYDYDIVEPHNLANQAYLHEHIGLHKVNALKDLTQKKLGMPADLIKDMRFINERVDQRQFNGFLFLLTDSMASRRQIVEAQSTGADSLLLHIFETRMASTHGNVFHFSPLNTAQRAAWFDTLIDDDKAEQSPCGTSISVGATASLIANLVVWEFMNFLLDDGCSTPQLDVFFKPMMFTTRDKI
tara:strand:+ start:990 stop:1679 length:690 start_codon:yes stop_codon:yes gene_type:complete